MKIVIIGQGNVGSNLMAAFGRRGVQPTYVSSRTLEGLPDGADVYIYTVCDAALEQVINKVRVHTRALHVHTSGTMPLTVFGDDKPHAAIMYPFQSFSRTQILDDMSQVPIFIQAKGIDDVAAVYSLALNISSHVYETTAHDRERLHVAGVFANNFTNLMYRCAEQMLQGTQIPFSALLPLIDETARKVHNLRPIQAQTGPARRGDEQVMAHHMAVIREPEMKQIYQLLSQQILSNYEQNN